MTRVSSAPIADLEALWARYLKLADPAPARPLPRDDDWTPPADKARSARRWRRVLALATSLASLGAADVIATVNPGATLGPLVVGGLLVVLLMRKRRPTPEKYTELAAALARAKATWHSLVEDWRTKTAGVDFASERRVILGFKRAARLQALAKPVSEAEQRLTYLEQFRIEDAGLFNIGAARIAVLRSWGVETAAEIDEEKVGSIPGFGRSLTERLVNWRESLEQRFHFEPAAITDPRDVQRIDRELAARRTRYMRELRPAFLGLEKRINDIGEERRALWQLLEAAFNERMLAWHDAESAAGH